MSENELGSNSSDGDLSFGNEMLASICLTRTIRDRDGAATAPVSASACASISLELIDDMAETQGMWRRRKFAEERGA